MSVEYDAQGHGAVDICSIDSSPSGGGPPEIRGVPVTGVVCHNGVSLHSTKEPCVPSKSCTHGRTSTSIDQIGIAGVEASEWGIGPPGKCGRAGDCGVSHAGGSEGYGWGIGPPVGGEGVVGWAAGWLVGWLVDGLVGWLVGLVVGWVVGWLAGWWVGCGGPNGKPRPQPE